jgi:aminoglycoside phosphotransferase (APT) family kinase protein
MTGACGCRSALGHLLGYLDAARPQDQQSWEGWRVAPMKGGRNNLLYRATSSVGDYVAKFVIPDERRRAHREFCALAVAEAADPGIAPRPVLVDEEGYHLPVVVQTWIDGDVLDRPPSSELGWRDLLGYLCAVHSITPATARHPLLKAISASSNAEARGLVAEQMARIPEQSRPTELRDLVRRFELARLGTWDHAPVALCRADPNLSNFIRRDGGLASVDWEYSGWGDPAFDVADLMAHPTYATVEPSTWDWVVTVSSDLSGDPDAAHRMRTYHAALLVWWCARLVRFALEVPRGLDRRLAAMPHGWAADVQTQYARYLDLATTHLDGTRG